MYEDIKNWLLGAAYPNKAVENAVYTLYNDKNMWDVIEKLKEKYLKNNEKVYISSKSFKEYLSTFNLLKDAALKEFGKFNSVKIARCCMPMPDYTGKNFLILMAVFFIFKNYDIILKIEELKSKKKFYSEPVPDWAKDLYIPGLEIDIEHYIDKEKILKDVDKVLNDYDKDEHIENLKQTLMLSEKKENLLELGKTVWDDMIKQREETGKKIKEMLKVLTKGTDNEHK